MVLKQISMGRVILTEKYQNVFVFVIMMNQEWSN